MKIYFVRHSLRDNSVKEDVIAPLTEEGHQKAELLIEFFRDKKIEMIFASPYKRVIETVSPIAENLKLPIKQIDGLRERKIGYWVEDFYDYAQQQWHDFDFKLENGESLNEVQNRIVQTYQSIIKNSDYETLLIGGHGTAMSLLFNDLTKGKFNYNDFLQMKMPSIYMWDTETEQLTHIQ
ncbi:histidine phosphatase family protein [Staphylococcus carnosus]|uniref:Histidine phosphatase family protein n=2 Tax=Staphylococcus carnosus TaxID=1281 RepID=B9DM67_STACT|nr:histidine phosphatase family protein [Staphylococcus carnosus]ANZ32792.1 phosphoglycerate kinase [Staphylococcus carnosus]KKB25231.1 phosphoglycerate kinase [Staphylococcus carnosus]KOR12750.1 phosphoglycerate kinase [Staphylococcus carnosus]POA06195.1 histidine phosphatase family protein [Staphylococcus carnosus]QPT04694.1 histidine phosphatase family protein [Staphylococcus carnosus]